MNKRTVLCLIVAAVILCSCACTAKNAGALLELDLSGGTTIEHTDTHGGFHGDGCEYTVMSFEESLSPQLAESPHWRRTPLTENMRSLLYGVDGRGPYLTCDDGRALFPLLNSYSWFFYDRHSECTNRYSDEAVFDRSSFNFTVALYDTESDVLYVCEFDT